VTEPLPPGAAFLITTVKDALRLRILIAIEARSMGAAELARVLDLPFDRVNWAVRGLAEAGLLTLDRYEPNGRGSALAKVYRTRHTGWDGLAAFLEAMDGAAQQG
jgi:DNA-binding transcriptional ArsR family regulator